MTILKLSGITTLDPMTMDLSTALSVGTAVIVCLMSLIILPLVWYIIRQKDEMIVEVRKELSDTNERIVKSESVHMTKLEQLRDQVTKLEKEDTRLSSEVNIVGNIRHDIGKLTEQVNEVVRELSSLKAVVSERSRSGSWGGQQQRPPSQEFRPPVVRTEDSDRPPRGR